METKELTRTLQNNVQETINLLDVTPTQFKAIVIMAGLSLDTAERLLDGETGFSINTLAKIANHLHCNIDDLISLT